MSFCTWPCTWLLKSQQRPGENSKSNAIAIERMWMCMWMGNLANVTQNRTPTQRANVSSSICLNIVHNLSVLPCPAPHANPPSPSPSVCLSVCLALLSDKFPVTEFCLSHLNRCFLLSRPLSIILSLFSTLAVPVRQVCFGAFASQQQQQQRRYCQKSAVWLFGLINTADWRHMVWGVFGFLLLLLLWVSITVSEFVVCYLGLPFVCEIPTYTHIGIRECGIARNKIHLFFLSLCACLLLLFLLFFVD